MIKQVSYKLCTCDICGHTAKCEDIVSLPGDWTRITAPTFFAFDLCLDCARATLKFLDERKESFKRAGDTSGK